MKLVICLLLVLVPVAFAKSAAQPTGSASIFSLPHKPGKHRNPNDTWTYKDSHPKPMKHHRGPKTINTPHWWTY
jgi:hypothetical protein